MCVECGTVLSVSSSPVAQQERDFIREQIAAGKDKEQIKPALVAEYGEEVLADPGTGGFNLDAVGRADRDRAARGRRHRHRVHALAAERGPGSRGGAAAAAQPRGRAPPGRGAGHVNGGRRHHGDRRVRGRLRLVRLALRAAARARLPVGRVRPVAGRDEVRRAGDVRILLPAIVFCLSFTVVFVALGMTATGLGSTLAGPAPDARQDRGRGDHRARHLLPADAVRAAAEQGVAPGRADQPRRLGRTADRGRRVRDRLDAVHRPDARLDPVRRRRPRTRSARAGSCSRSTRSASPCRSCSPPSRSRA